MQLHDGFRLAVLSVLASSCFKAALPTSTSVIRGTPYAQAVTQLSETKSITTVNTDSTSDTVISVGTGNTLSGTSITIAPGSLKVLTNIIVEQAADLGDTSVVSEVALTSDVAISAASAGVIIRPSSQAELSKPLQLNLPLPLGLGLLADGANYAVFYKYLDPAKAQLVTGIKVVDGVDVKVVFDEASRRETIKFEGFFGAYWAVKLSRPLATNEAPVPKASELPIANKANTPVFTAKGVVSESAVLISQAKPELVWPKPRLTYDAATRVLSLSLEGPLTGSIKGCKADFFKSATDIGGLSIETGAEPSAVLSGDKVPVGAVLGRFRCQDETDRLTLSSWSEAVTVPLPVDEKPLPSVSTTATSTSISAAKILSISTPKPDGLYKASEMIPLTVTYSENVTVSGTPYFNLETGTNDTPAFYASGSGSSTLVFLYTVVAGDESADLEYKAGSVQLNEGAILDSRSLPALLALPQPALAAAKAIGIDAVPPSAPASVGFSSSRSTNATFSLQWAAGTDTNFATHNVKLCSSIQCSTNCISASTSLASPMSITGLNGGTYYGCVQAVDTLGQTSPWVASLNPISVDTLAPTVTRVYSTSAAGSYGPGSSVQISVEFSEAVQVSGSPGLLLETGPIDRTATFTSGSGTPTLNFIYNVQTGDVSTDLSYLSVGSLSGSIRDDAGNSAVLTLPSLDSPQSLAGQSSIVIDASPATIVNVTSPLADGAWGSGSFVDITVNFSRAVVVGVASPQLNLNTSPPRSAIYFSGSGTSTLTFRYAIQAGDLSADLDYSSASALVSNGATIRNGTIDAYLTLPSPGSAASLGGSKALVIAGASPNPNLIGPVGFVTALDGVQINPIDINDSITANDTTSDGRPITYTCVYDTTIDGSVIGGTACSTLPSSSFNSATGVFSWTPPTPPNRTTYAPYELKISGQNTAHMEGAVYVAIKVLDSFNDSTGYESGTEAQYAFDNTRLDFSGGYVRLRPFDQSDDENEANWGGQPKGADHSVAVMKQNLSGGCNGNTTNCFASLSGDWIPLKSNLIFSSGFEAALNTEFTLAAGASKMGASGAVFGSTHYLTKSNLAPANFTVSLWVKTTQIQGENSCATFGEGAPLITALVIGANQNDWGISACNGFVKAGTGNADTTLSSTRAINDGRWHMITFTRIQSGIMKLFVDGALESSASSNAYTLNAASLIHFGKSPSTNYGYIGNMDEVGIWSAALSDDEVMQVYERQSVENAGIYLSRVMDGQVPVSWDFLKIKTSLPFGKELPDFGTSEVALAYPALVPNLVDNIRALYHLNESAGTSVAVDSSGNNNNGAFVDSPQIGVAGKFRRSVSFNGNSHVNIPNTSSLQFGTSSLTVSAWVRPNQATGQQRIVSNGYFSANAGFNLSMRNEFVTFGLCGAGGSVSVCSQVVTSVPVADGGWHHVAGVVDASSSVMRIFVDGVPSALTIDTTKGACGTLGSANTELNFSGCTVNGTGSLGSMQIGGYKVSSTYYEGFRGQIDEVALWGRSLSNIEINQVYRRGSERVLAQVRTCADATCTSTSGWKGPDLTPRSFYSEIHNYSSAPSFTGYVRDTALQIPLLSFGFTDSNRYFQYRLILEGSDRAGRCSGMNCGPEVLSVGIGPDHFPSQGVSITRTAPYSYFSLASLANTYGPNGCSQGVRYQFSLDNSVWRWYNGSSWTTSDGTFDQANPASLTSLPQWGSQVGRGQIYIRALLKSNGVSGCELDAWSLFGNTVL
jgi:hypothetical protein